MNPRILRPLLPLEASRLAISWPYSVGLRANPNAGREFILTNKLLPSGGFNQVEISRRFNLGNHIRQTVNAVRFAELHGIPMVALPSGSIFSPGMAGDVELIRSEDSPRNGTRALIGDFFYFEKIGIPMHLLQRGRILENLRPLVPLLINKKITAKLGIHLRSGDTFSSNPHPLYMPPPLKFFFESIDRSHATGTVGVHVISQDLQHPYIAALADYCKQKQIDYSVSSSSLEEDFRSLASFEELCISQGTLALAAAWLSGGCKKIFAFQRDPGEMQTTAELGIRVESAQSVRPLGPWTGSEVQMRQLSDPLAIDVRWESINVRNTQG